MHPFFTFEGPEGSGKSTQIQLLYENLLPYYDVLVVREPGGTRIGESVRTLLLNTGGINIGPRAETLLFAAARAQLVEEVIGPALEASKVVLCDRYTDSTLAYQGYGRGQNLAPLKSLNAYATRGLEPCLRFYLNLPPEEGLKRIRETRMRRSSSERDWNRMDAQDLSFHQTVHSGYLELIRENPVQWECLDATLEPAELQRKISRKTISLLPPARDLTEFIRRTDSTDSQEGQGPKT